MSPSPQLSSFIARRFDDVLDQLMAAGFDLDANARDRSLWSDAPPLGLIRIKGVWLPRADIDEDGDADSRFTLSIIERWSEERTGQAEITESGLWLAAYSYNGHIEAPAVAEDGRNHRHDFDVEKHPDEPYHLHPFGVADAGERRAEEAQDLAGVIADFRVVIDKALMDGLITL